MSGTITQKTVQQLFNPEASDSFSASQSSSIAIQKISSTGHTWKQLQKDLDTSSTTKPDQLCFNCVRKHLGLAYMFASQGGDKKCRTALGQLMCISLHLKQSFPNLAYRVQDVALRLLRQKDKQCWPKVIKELFPVFQQDPKQDLPQYPPLPMLGEQQELLTLLLVYSLLFVQVSYQPMNVLWATAHLSYFAYNSFRDNSSIQQYQAYRSLWKLIQSMSLLDQNYIAARDYLSSLIASKYPMYIGITVEHNQDLFKKQYQEQERLIQKLQQQKSLPQSS